MTKKIISLFLLICVLLSVASCGGNGTPEQPEATPTPVAINENEVDVLTERWVATELSFSPDKAYSDNDGFDVSMDAVFTNRTSGTSLKIPAFFDGNNTFRVRFAPTEYGIWDVKTECADEPSLNGITKTVGANAYTGELEIYKRGFVNAEQGKKYFTYADGTPFLYIGDTHWAMYSEELNTAGPNGGGIQTDSHFKYIVDKRVEQGFTVYQSEPINAPFNLSDRLSGSDLDGLQTADIYYKYIAEKGLVHANAEFFYPNQLTDKLVNNQAYLEKISRYWVARFGAYPVMWTLAQEVDNDCQGDAKYNYMNNPWVKIAEYIHKYDAYSHPLTAHQRGTGHTTVTGTGSEREANGMSAFAFAEKFNNNFATGHSWWGAQWGFKKNRRYADDVPKDYWASEKPAVMYESPYCYQWTDDFGARVQSWVAFLSGMCGYGYGVIDVWAYKGGYNAKIIDGTVHEVTDDDLKKKWSEVLECPSTLQLAHLKTFLEKYEWWTFIPDFYDMSFFLGNQDCLYANASNGNGTYIIYMYNRNTSTGRLTNLDEKSTYSLMWFNPRTGEYTEGDKNVQGDNKQRYSLPDKPDIEDWVLIVTKN